MSHYTARPLPHSSALVMFLAKQLDELKGDTTLREIAVKLGYSQGNIISMFKSGECKIPLEKVPALAEALDVDVAHLMRLGLEQYWPDKMNVITEVFSRMVTANEMAFLMEVRKLTNHADPQLTLTTINGRAIPQEIAGVALKVGARGND